MSIPQITHVIFDFDGILVDSERQYSKANELCLKPYGKCFTNELKIAQMGRKKLDAVKISLEKNDLVGKVDMEEYLNNYDSHLKNLIPKSPELPGVSKLINHLHANNIPLAICTGSSNEEFELKTKNFDKNHWINKISFCVLSGSDPDIKNGKPHPEPYLVTMSRFKKQPVSPKNVLVFEDSINGVTSAIEAGMTVIMIPQLEFMPHSWTEIKKQFEPKVSEFLNSMEEFIPEKYGLPSY